MSLPAALTQYQIHTLILWGDDNFQAFLDDVTEDAYTLIRGDGNFWDITATATKMNTPPFSGVTTTSHHLLKNDD